MDNRDLDFDKLSHSLQPKRQYRLADVAGKVRKVAFDVVRFTDTDNLDKLWRVETINDEEYIVAMYGEDDVVEKTASSNPWRAIVNGNGLDVFYKGANVGGIVAPNGYNIDDLALMAQWVPAKLASDESFVKNYISSMTKDEAEVLATLAPELMRN